MLVNMTPSTELPRAFYAGIGPLQLSVVVFIFINNAVFHLSSERIEYDVHSSVELILADRYKKVAVYGLKYAQKR